MPRCQWCSRFTREPRRIDNGRTELVLCPLCDAERQLRAQPELTGLELPAPSPWGRLWRRLRGLWTDDPGA